MNVPLLDVPFGMEAEGIIQSGFIRRDGIDARPSAAARFALMAIADLIEASANQIDRLERAILVEAKRDENMRRLTTIPGVGCHYGSDHLSACAGSRRVQVGAPLCRLARIDTAASFKRR